jgi:hypothetical protein
VPARREYTPEELAARLDRDRERARVGMQALRQRRKVNATGVNVTPIKEGRVNGTPPQTPPYGGTTRTSEKTTTVGAVFAPFEARGYRHDPAFWAKLAGAYPGVDLELEAMKLADWLEAPKNQKLRCSRARIDNWMKKAHADLLAAPLGAKPAPRTNGTATNGVYHQPQSQQPNRRPDYRKAFDGDLGRIDPLEAGRALAERKRFTFEEKLAMARGGGK